MNPADNNNLIPKELQNGFTDILDLHSHIEQQIRLHGANQFANLPYRYRLVNRWMELLAEVEEGNEENAAEGVQNEQPEPNNDNN